MTYETTRCPCATTGCQTTTLSSSGVLRLSNNAGSPQAIENEAQIKEILSKPNTEGYLQYTNVNDVQDKNHNVLALHAAVAARENVDPGSLLFYVGGLSFLQRYFASYNPALTVMVKGDFPGYSSSASGLSGKLYAVESNNFIDTINVVKPDVAVFTAGETNPGLTKLNAHEIVAEIRRKSPLTTIIVDQAYGRHHGDDISINKLIMKDDRVIVLRPASKDTGAVGIRLAWTITQPGGYCHQLLKSIVLPYDVSVDVVAKAAAIYEHPDALDRIINTQHRARKCLTHLLASRDVEVRSSASPWVLIKTLKDAALAAKQLAAENILVQCQDELQDDLKGFIRVSTTTCAEMIAFVSQASKLKLI